MIALVRWVSYLALIPNFLLLSIKFNLCCKLQKYGDLKWHTFVISQFHESGIWVSLNCFLCSESHEAEIKVSSEGMVSPEAGGPRPSSCRCWQGSFSCCHRINTSLLPQSQHL